MSLEDYHKKRNFKESSEPKGTLKKSNNVLRFVVQRHAATRLHYDFRLEIDGVLKSWAVPKGPSLYPSDKRLAMNVEDHPFEYRNFEGTIPARNYGAGEVEIWDEGTYEPIEIIGGKSLNDTMTTQFEKESLKFILHGKKLRGEFALVKIKNASEQNAWLLIKHNDDFAVNEPYNAEDYTKKSSKVTALIQKKAAKKKVQQRNQVLHLDNLILV